MKETALYQEHIRLGGKIVDFGGWALPVQFSGIIEEHLACREAAGLFDVSHMGEIMVEGPEAEAFIQYLVTNDISIASDNHVIYSPMCYPDGGVVDDLLIYKFNKEKYLLVVNASNLEKDWQWINEQKKGQVELIDLSEQISELALQGPKAQQILARLTDADLDNLKFYTFEPEVIIAGAKALLSRTGYTGEDGFEIYLDNADAARIWRQLLEAGEADGLTPVGLGARDTLRFEVAMPLYGQEIDARITPLEAGLGSFVKADKPDYIGKEALAAIRAAGVRRKTVGFEMVGRGVARSHFPVVKEENGPEIGFVTTGSYAPSVGKNLGMALLSTEYAAPGERIYVIIRGKAVEARIIPRPFHKKNYKK